MNVLLSGLRLLLLPLLAVAVKPAPPPSNQCEQSYRLLFKERERDVFWIAENLYGECSQSNLIQVDVSRPEPHSRSTALKEFDQWRMLEQTLKQAIEHEQPTEILPRNGVLTLGNTGVKIKAPERNKTLEQMYLQDFFSECARQWNDGMRQAGIDMPVISGAAVPKLLYVSPDGLYFNYRIDKAYLFPDSRTLILFTKNNTFRCNSEISSMHGFMIMRMVNI